MRKKLGLSAIFITLFLGVSFNSYALPVVNYTNTYDSGTGIWKYESTIFNDTTDLLYDYFISLEVETSGGADLTSDGWGVAWLGNSSPYFVDWIGDIGAEILPGGTMEGFWFTYNGSSSDDIGSLAYTVTLWDIAAEAGYAISGVTFNSGSSPLPVPEPGTIILLAIGLLGLSVHNNARLLNSGKKSL